MILALRCQLPSESHPNYSWVYRLAGCGVVTDTPLDELHPFKTSQRKPFPASNPALLQPPEKPRVLYKGPGWIAGRLRNVACRCDSHGYWLQVAGIGIFRITAEECTLVHLAADRRTVSEEIVKILLGPAFALAVALQNRYCLRASAAASDDSAVVFLGDKGAGSSSVASYLAASSDSRWRSVASDVLPVDRGSQGPAALPHFPQLRKTTEAREQQGIPERLSLAVIYVLDPSSERVPGPKSIEIRPLQPRGAAFALVRHTMTARLFAPTVLKNHMAFCAETPTRIPIRRLSYPQLFRNPERIRDAILRDLQRLAA